MRIETWNLEGRWSVAHHRLLEDADADVWLLTEVPSAFALDGGELVRSEEMQHTNARSWTALWSAEPLDPLGPVHPAAALARRGEILFCSCVLPWSGAGLTWPGKGDNTPGRTIAALECLRPALVSTGGKLVWGGWPIVHRIEGGIVHLAACPWQPRPSIGEFHRSWHCWFLPYGFNHCSVFTYR